MSFKHKHKLIQIQIDMLQIQSYIHLIDDIDHVLQIQMQIDTCANTNRYNYKLKCRIYNIHIDHVLQIQVQIDTNTIWYAANTKLCPPDRWHWPCPSGPLLKGPSQKCASPFKRNCLGVSDKCNIDVILFEGRAVFLSPSGDLGIGLVWDNNPTTTFRFDCWNLLQTELNHLWWVLSCS